MDASGLARADQGSIVTAFDQVDADDDATAQFGAGSHLAEIADAGTPFDGDIPTAIRNAAGRLLDIAVRELSKTATEVP